MVQALKRRHEEAEKPRKSPRLDEDEEMHSGSGDDALEGNESAQEPGGDDEEAEEWGGVSGDVAPPVLTSTTKPPPAGPGLHKPPTGVELRAIKDAADLFKSSSFKMQIDALLPNVRPKPSRLPPLERFLFALHRVLSSLSPVQPAHPLEAARKLLKKGVAVPYCNPLPTEETNWKVGFEPPQEIVLVGSWANKVAVKKKDDRGFGIDLAVEMPNSLFQEKDYLNARYFQKRAFYLATIAAALKSPKSKLSVDVAYESLMDDPRLTKLVLTPQPGGNSEADFTKLNGKIYIIPVLPLSSPIALHRLSPAHSNLRLHSSSEASTSALPTPRYNTAILRTLTPKPYLLFMHRLQKECESFTDALTLLRVWANQRGFGEGDRAVARGAEGLGNLWWVLLALLLEGEERVGGKKVGRRPVGRGLSSYQLFKAALESLATHDWKKGKVFVKSADGPRFDPEEYSNQPAVLVDPASLVNVVSGIPLGTLNFVKHQAQVTLNTLNTPSLSGDPFVSTFLKDSRNLLTQFDTILRVDLSSASLKLTDSEMDVHDTLDTGSATSLLFERISDVLTTGLGSRARAVVVLHPTPTARGVERAHPGMVSEVWVGIVHNPDLTDALRLVDHGPAVAESGVDDEMDGGERKRFKELWGPKAELRRFKDGRILESVVWEVKTSDERAHVPTLVVRYLLERHFGIHATAVDEEVKDWKASWDTLTRLPPQISQEVRNLSIATGAKAALTAFDSLVKTLKSLASSDDDSSPIPLSILNVSPIAPSLRYTTPFVPVAMTEALARRTGSSAQFGEPIVCIVEFERSSRWPDELSAIQATKMAFLTTMAEALLNSPGGFKASVIVLPAAHDTTGLGDKADRTFLEVETAEGWTFHLKIYHPREAFLLHQVSAGPAALTPHIRTKALSKARKTREGQAAIAAYSRWEQTYIHAPRHHRAIGALTHRWGAYAGTVRLVQRWLSAHWVGAALRPEAIELLCAAVFIQLGARVDAHDGDEDSEKKEVEHGFPASKETGFAAVVRFLKEWKYEEGLMAPVYGSAGAALDAPSDIPGAPKGTSTILGVWRIKTEVDEEGCMWTRDGPDALTARRIRSLADAAWKVMDNLGTAGDNGSQLDLKTLFTHPTEDYDFLIQLDPSVLPRYMHNISADSSYFTQSSKYANASMRTDGPIHPSFDPAALFHADILRVYQDTIKVFWDPLGGNTFGCIWDPSVCEPRPFRILGGFSSIPVAKEGAKEKEKAQVVLNTAAILAEVERMGRGLVKKIVVQRDVSIEV